MVSALAISSCGVQKPVRFTVEGTKLFAMNSISRGGIIDFSKPEELSFRFDDSLFVPPDSSLEIEYELNFTPSDFLKDNCTIVITIDGISQPLPMDFLFLGITGKLHYALPVDTGFSGNFNIKLVMKEKVDVQAKSEFKIKAVRFTDRWYGFKTVNSTDVFATPFVSSGNSFVITAPALPLRKFPQLYSRINSSKQSRIEFSDYRIDALAGTENFFIPGTLLQSGSSAVLSGEGIESFVMTLADHKDFPVPIEADPGLILDWPQKHWRNPRYEIFRWDRFPSILILDIKDYDIQSKLLKRLAFFVEKKGFRGRLVTDREMEGQHGWNAHDYRAVDLARFFDTARKTNFPLLPEEWELEKILLIEDVIRESSGSITEGEGALLSISRESPDYLRYRFLAHEGFHGLFFIDSDFRDYSRQRWELFPASAKKFLLSFFDYQQYDIKDEYLLINEFMAHILQQSVNQAGDYFGRTLPSRFETTWRRESLPAKEGESWPELASAFTSEARAFSNYVNERWNLAAGRVWNLIIRD